MSAKNKSFYDNGKWWTYGPRDTPFSFLYRQVLYPYRMLPKIRKYGIRYLYDQPYRKRVRQKQRGGTHFTQWQRQWLYKRSKICQRCKLTFPIKKLTVDHLLKYTHPDYKKFKYLQLLCDPCHAIKDNRVPKHVELNRSSK